MVAKEAIQEELNPFEIAKQQFNKAADYLELDDSTRQVLSNTLFRSQVCKPARDSIALSLKEHFLCHIISNHFRDMGSQRQGHVSCPRRDIEGHISRLRAREFDSFAERARVTVNETAAVGCGCWTELRAYSLVQL